MAGGPPAVLAYRARVRAERHRPGARARRGAADDRAAPQPDRRALRHARSVADRAQGRSNWNRPAGGPGGNQPTDGGCARPGQARARSAGRDLLLQCRRGATAERAYALARWAIGDLDRQGLRFDAEAGRRTTIGRTVDLLARV